MLQDGCLGVVDKYFGWDTAKKLEGVLMGLEEVFGSLAQAELDVNQAAVAKHHDKEDRLLVEPTFIAPAQPQST